MKLVSCIRQRNGIKYLPRLMKQLESISDNIIVLDQTSTDGSLEWLKDQVKQLQGKLYVIVQPETDFDGGRDWNILYDCAEAYNPDWVYMPDIDELIDENQQQYVRQLIDQTPKEILGWSFPFYYLWNDEQHYRGTGRYENTRVTRLFRYNKEQKPPMRKTHATAVPEELDKRLVFISPIRMMHFGYMDLSDRKAKYDWYTNRDSDPSKAGAGVGDYSHFLDETPELRDVPSLSEWAKTISPNDLLAGKPIQISWDIDIPGFKRMDKDGFQCVPQSVANVVFHYDKVVDLEDKQSVFAALRPGGRLDFIFKETTDVVSLDKYLRSLEKVGFINVQNLDRDGHYIVAYKPGPMWL